MDKLRVREIYNWMNTGERYKEGVTNESVINNFGSKYLDAWNKLKKRKNWIFHENGKWYRWQ